MEAFFTNPTSQEIWADRYRKHGETFAESLHRVADAVATNDKEQYDFFNVMMEGKFFPAGRTMSNAGLGQALTLNNCFVAPMVRDEFDDIFPKVCLGAKTHQRGGGIGYAFSALRPNGTPTSNEAIASGPVSFMDVFNAQTATVNQGSRRGANMGMLSVYHPDIVEFVTAKSKDPNRLQFFNLSVVVDDVFMQAVENNENIYLHWPVYDDNGKHITDPDKWRIKKEVSANELWDLIMQNAYDNGEPGIFFYDNLNRDNNLSYIENIVCSNPCCEYVAGTVYGNNPVTGEPLDPNEYGGACNLGSLFLPRFVLNPFTDDASMDWEELTDTIYIAVKMLDNIIDINNFPDQIYKNYQEAFRTIGLGVTGLADCLAMLGLKYNSSKAREFVDDLMSYISAIAFQSSADIAERKGAFPFYDAEKYYNGGYLNKHFDHDIYWGPTKRSIQHYGIRNAKIMSIAPTGTLSLVYGNNCSSGIEPIFCLEYDRKVKVGGQDETNAKIIPMVDYAYALWKQMGSPEKYKDVFVTAMEMDVEDHLAMLAVIAKHVDMSVSKTINVPTDYPFEKTKDIYMQAWKAGIKGCTIFRPNALRPGVLMTSSDENQDAATEEQTVTPALQRGDIIDCSDDLIGMKRKLCSGCGSLHVLAYFDATSGELQEVYLAKGSTGGCANFMTGLSRMISLLCRAGVSVYDIKDQLDSTGACPSYASRSATKHDTSKGSCCPMAIGNALIEMYEEMQDRLDDSWEKNDEAAVEETADQPEAAPVYAGPTCPECGEPLTAEGGCFFCRNCSYSKCE